jgi:Domain of Unknown Function (DUF1080)
MPQELKTVKQISRMILLFICLPGGLSNCDILAAESEPKKLLEEGFRVLFDGTSFDDEWEGNREWFRVAEGAIIAGSLEKAIPHNEFLCTKKRFENFELRLEVKLRGEGNNAGVQFRTERIPNDTEVSGYQADVGNAFKRSVWGALYDESRRKKMLAEGPAESVAQWTKEGDWNEIFIIASGSKIKIFLNGNQTIDYVEEDASIAKSGIIGLQIHSGPPTEALYRNIRVKEAN